MFLHSETILGDGKVIQRNAPAGWSGLVASGACQRVPLPTAASRQCCSSWYWYLRSLVFFHFPYHYSLYVSLASLLLSPCSDICIFDFSLGDSVMTWRKEDSPILTSSGNECHNFWPGAKKPMSFTDTTCIRFPSSSFVHRHVVKVTGRGEVHRALLARLAGRFEF